MIPGTLSARDREVLGLIVQGLSDEEIAGELDCACSTIETLRSALENRLGARNRIELARLAFEHASAASEAKYRTLFEAAGDAIFLMELGPDGPIFLDCNRRALEMFDRPREQIVGMSPADPSLSTPTQLDGRPSVEVATKMVQAALAGTPQRFEWDHYRRDGSLFHSEVTLNRLDLGDTIFIQAITRDITERKRAEDFKRLMMSELNHRVRNNLTSIIALIPMTSASSSSQQELEEKLTGRIHAMAVAQESLAAHNWLGVQISHVIRRMIQQYAHVERDRLSIEGPDVDLPAGVSGPFSMCINELATNAVKHGALSTARGSVRVTWTMEQDRRLEVTWRETDGPPIESAPVIRPGRGLDLVRGFVEHQLRGDFSIACSSEALEISMSFPLVELTYHTLPADQPP